MNKDEALDLYIACYIAKHRHPHEPSKRIQETKKVYNQIQEIVAQEKTEPGD